MTAPPGIPHRLRIEAVAVRLDGRVPAGLTVPEAVRRLSGRERVIAISGSWAVGALVACDPLRAAPQGPGPFAAIADQPPVEGGGAAVVGGGWFGYLSFPATRVPGFPRSSLAWYPDLLRFDGTSWWYEALRYEALCYEAPSHQALCGEPAGAGPAFALDAGAVAGRLDRLCADLARPAAPALAELEVSAWPDCGAHVLAVEECVRAIRRGEVYQANIAGRCEGVLRGSPHEAWARLVEAHDPARAALVADPAGTAVCASPELFLHRTGRTVRTAPIKGTRPRPGGAADGRERERLAASAKDAAENVMIVDLMRNDLSRVCATGSVRVPRLLTVEPHAGVWHLVSEVEGTLAPGRDDADLLAATFPPGSVTGAPKIRAVELIEQLEGAPRGLFTGAIGYASPLAGLELAVAIRTLEVEPGGRVTIGVGGGVTVDSTPVEEWAECLTKAAPLVSTLAGAAGGPGGAPVAHPPARTALFETLLAIDGRPRRPADHLARLRRSWSELTGGPLAADLAGAVTAALRGGSGPARVRLDVDRSGTPHVTVTEWTPVGVPGQPGVVLRVRRTPGTGVDPVADPRRHKLAGRAELEAHEAAVAAGETPLLVAPDGAVLETTRSSVFVIDAARTGGPGGTGAAGRRDGPGGRLRTPPLDGRILPGTARQAILDLDRTARPAPLTLADLAAAAGVFLTNALRGVQWVRELRDENGVSLACWPAPHPAALHLGERLAADDR